MTIFSYMTEKSSLIPTGSKHKTAVHLLVHAVHDNNGQGRAVTKLGARRTPVKELF